MTGMGRDMLWAYMAGWSHGTSDRRRDMDKYDHDKLLVAEYARGHADGRAARVAAARVVEARLEAAEAAAPRRSC